MLENQTLSYSDFKDITTVIYIPTYNCEKSIANVLKSIPKIEKAIAIVLDNASEDKTSDVVKNSIKNNEISIKTILIQNEINIGYAKSQKKMYSLIRDIENITWIAMLHGDGQYDPNLISKFIPIIEKDLNYDVVYGYRSKIFSKDETPFYTYFIIKILSILESLITRQFRHEWHSGFVMYRTRFLRKLNFDIITDTPHIDGNILFCAGLMKSMVKAIPIYKKYKKLNSFEGSERIKYVLSVFILMFKFTKLKKSDIERRI